MTTQNRFMASAVAALLIAALSACGGRAEPTATPVPPTPTAVAVAPTAEPTEAPAEPTAEPEAEPTAEPQAEAMAEAGSPIDVVTAFQTGVWGEGNLDLVESMTTDDFDYGDNEPGDAGRQAYLADAQQLLGGMTGMAVEVNDIFAEGNQVVARWTASGTASEAMGAPAGAVDVTVWGITFNEVADGKIASEIGVSDMLGLMTQLGFVPPMDEAAPADASGDAEGAGEMAEEAAAEPMAEVSPEQVEAHRATLRRITEEIWGGGNNDLVDELYAEGFVMHSGGVGAYADAAGLKQSVELMRGAFSDISVQVNQIVASGNKAAVHYTVSAKHTGDAMGIPATGADIVVDGVSLVYFDDEGLVTDEWAVGDDLGMLTQMGVVPPMGGDAPEASVPSTPVASGLNGPQGVYVAEDGSVWAIDSGMGGDTQFTAADPASGEDMPGSYGMSARIVQVSPDGTQTDVAVLPSVLVGQGMDAEAIGGARLTVLDGTVYATSGGWVGTFDIERPDLLGSIVKLDDGEVVEVANTWAFEEANNPDGFILESHPYDIATGPDGMLWVAEAGANELLKIDPATGDIELVAVLDGVEGMPFPNPNRGDAMEMDPVPTGVVANEDGSAYVSLLPGFPFLPGSSKVVMVSADGEVSDYATGLTMTTDLTQGPDGNLYAVQFGVFTDQGPQFNSGAIIRIMEGGAAESVVTGLSFPTSIAFDADGNAYVTINGVGAPGSGQVVRFDGLTELEGTPLAAEGGE